MPSAVQKTRWCRLRSLGLAALLVSCERPAAAPAPPPVPTQSPAPVTAAAIPLPLPVSPAVLPLAAPPAPPPVAVDTHLRALAGPTRAVLLDVRGDGVWARTLDGAVDQRLVAGTWNTIWPDAAARVLWLWREADGMLGVVDLAQTEIAGADLPRAVTLATGVEAGLQLAPVVRSDTPRTVRPGTTEPPVALGPRLRLDLAADPPGFWFRAPPQPGHWRDPPVWRPCSRAGHKPVAPRCPRLTPNASQLIGMLAARASAVMPPGPAPVPGRLATLLPGCAREACGRPVALPESRWWLVPAAVWTDCCRRGHQLYDHESHRFLRLTSGHLEPGPSSDRRDAVEFLWLCPGEEAVVTESGVVPLRPPGPLQFGRADACLGALPVRMPSQPCPQGDQCEDEPATADPDGMGVD